MRIGILSISSLFSFFQVFRTIFVPRKGNRKNRLPEIFLSIRMDNARKSTAGMRPSRRAFGADVRVLRWMAQAGRKPTEAAIPDKTVVTTATWQSHFRCQGERCTNVWGTVAGLPNAVFGLAPVTELSTPPLPLPSGRGAMDAPRGFEPFLRKAGCRNHNFQLAASP